MSERARENKRTKKKETHQPPWLSQYDTCKCIQSNLQSPALSQAGEVCRSMK